ncbi:MAG: hypothetical protein NTV01_18480 [Bacteroidia bacterium]|nr:hypothetical protein [Bacteroidia bacterium]
MTGFFKWLLKIMRYVMPLFYLAVGLLLTFTKIFGKETGKFRFTLGILLIGYSVFRTWRIIKDHENLKENGTSAN